MCIFTRNCSGLSRHDMNAYAHLSVKDDLAPPAGYPLSPASQRRPELLPRAAARKRSIPSAGCLDESDDGVRVFSARAPRPSSAVPYRCPMHRDDHNPGSYATFLKLLDPNYRDPWSRRRAACHPPPSNSAATVEVDFGSMRALHTPVLLTAYSTL